MVGARAEELFAPDEATLAGCNADIYFERSRQILAAEDLDPVVVVEFFARQRALLCGMREVQALLRRVLPATAQVWCLDEGTWIEPLEVVLRIRGPYRHFGLYETALLGMLSSETGWATAAAAWRTSGPGPSSPHSSPSSSSSAAWSAAIALILKMLVRSAFVTGHSLASLLPQYRQSL